MKPADFDYPLPEELIARYPLEERSASRLLVLHKDTGTLEHKNFTDISGELKPGDLLLLNDTRVIPARVVGRKKTGGKVEILALRKTGSVDGGELWQCMVKSSKGIKEGAELFFSNGDDGLEATAVERDEAGFWTLAFNSEGVIDRLFDVGLVPLPPYLGREAEPLDTDRYQTVFAKHLGAVAAPTAGLHFTDKSLAELKSGGIPVRYLTLHTGLATFMPVRDGDVSEHTVPAERYNIPSATADAIIRTKKNGSRVVAVGTTVTRAVEAAFQGGLNHAPVLKGETSLFILPGFDFKVVDALLTNFHLPCSTLLMLASAFGGRENIMKAYNEAVARKYRFFSYGDCMLII